MQLTAKEYELLRCLAAEPTRVFTRAELLRDVWGYPSGSRSRTVDSHAARLRQKLHRPGEQRLIVNVWGVGWRLTDPPDRGRRSDAREAGGEAAPPGPKAGLALEDLYRELAVDRARNARTALAGERDRTRLFAQSAAALEEAAGVLHHAAAAGLGKPRAALDEHAAGLEAAAARFELAADITRARRAR